MFGDGDGTMMHWHFKSGKYRGQAFSNKALLEAVVCSPVFVVECNDPTCVVTRLD
jgi:hypothetical protein